VEELEQQLEEANAVRRQLEVALETAAEEVAATRARVEEVLPTVFDEAAPADGSGGTRILSPAEVEPTFESDDDDVSDGEPEPVLTAAQQWSQLWSGAKAKAEVKAKAGKAAKRAAGQSVDS
jgi:hypothetical protein